MTTASPTKEKELLRISTAGSVDDGKSTLIGRLLYDSKNTFEDQVEAVVPIDVHDGNTDALTYPRQA